MSVTAQDRDRAMDAANGSNPCAGSFGALYSFYIERRRLSRVIGGLAWGIDSAPLYGSLTALETVPDRSVILDVPCGSGLALGHLRPSQRVSYLAVDLDPRMLARTADRAERDGLSQVDCLRADVTELPIPTSAVDLCLCHGGLHSFADPAKALGEIARCLRPGGRLLGTTFVGPSNLRQRFLFSGLQRRNGLPELWGAEELADELTRAGFTNLKLGVRAGYALFDADRFGRGR
jgi:SAM-dependent methyltransferase